MLTNTNKNLCNEPKKLETLILGLGDTGVSAANYFSKKGHNVTIIDSRPNPPGLNDLKSLSKKIKIHLETLDVAWMEGKEQIIVSPGIKNDIPILIEARRIKIPILSDIEIFVRKVSNQY